MSNSAKKIIQLVVIFSIGAAFLYFVFNGTDWADMWLKFTQANYMWLAAGMLISLISHWIRAYRATMLYEPLGFSISTTNSFYAVLIGYFMNYFIPRGGEVSRCASLNKTDDLPVEKGLGTVITERLVDMVFLVLILGLVFVIQFDVIYGYISNNAGKSGSAGGTLKYWIIGSVIILAVLFFILRKKLTELSFFGKVMDKLKGFVQGLSSIRQVKRPLLFITLSASIWICYVLMMYFCLFALESTEHLNFAQCLTVFAMGTIGVVVPAPGAGAGSYHFAVIQGLLLFGVAEDDGRIYATIVHGAQMVILIALGAISSLIVLKKQKHKSN